MNITAPTPCLCGCGTLTESKWAPGHDSIMLWSVLREKYGDKEGFLRAHGDID